jgi:hypothetical protein
MIVMMSIQALWSHMLRYRIPRGDEPLTVETAENGGILLLNLVSATAFSHNCFLIKLFIVLPTKLLF